MDSVAARASLLNICVNTFLFIIKLWASVLSGSIVLASEAFNSLTDMVTSIAVLVCVKISDSEADEGHPFGHHRAEPIAGILVAILAGILGFEILRASIVRLFSGTTVVIGTFALLVPVITIIIKIGMALYFKKIGREVNSPAITASYLDSLSDVLVAVAALAGIIGAWFGYTFLDPIASLPISLWIIYTGYKIGMENIDYLVGKAPGVKLMDDIKAAAISINGVKTINTVRAHYVGPYIHVEIHIEVDRNLSTFDSHAIGKDVERKVESIRAIEKSFIHVDPV